MNKKQRPDGLWSLEADQGHILHRVGADDWTPIRQTTVTDPDSYEEIAIADIPPYTQAQYKAKTVELIRRRYDSDDECAILRQRDTKPEEFAQYNAYVEQCKTEAKRVLASGVTTEPPFGIDEP